jgi:hypothetical protein
MPFQLHGLLGTSIIVDSCELDAFASGGKSITHIKVHPTLDQVLLPSPLVHPSLVLAFQHSPLMCPTLRLFYHMHVLASSHSPLQSKRIQRNHKCYFTLVLHVLFSQNSFFIRMIFWMIFFATCYEIWLELPQQVKKNKLFWINMNL